MGLLYKGAELEIYKSIYVLGLTILASVCGHVQNPHLKSEDILTEALEIHCAGINALLPVFLTKTLLLASNRPVLGPFLKEALRPAVQPSLGCLLQDMQL